MPEVTCECGSVIEVEHTCKQEANLAVVKTKVEGIEGDISEMKEDVKDLVRCIKGNGAGKGLIARIASLATQQTITWGFLFVILSGLLGRLASFW